jgi:pimeloyl-ACP methyl ester carboxylesterase
MSQSATKGLSELETSFGSLKCWDHGPIASGPPLIFLQGLIAGPDAWSGVLRALTDRHRCITVDWPFGAHQRPMRAEADLSPPALAGLVIEVLDQLGLERAVLVGNDSGGVISQLVLTDHPDRISALVLVACDAFECFPPAQYRPLFRLVRVPGVVRLLAAAMNRPAFATSRLGYGAVARDPADLLHWARPLASDALIRRDLRKLISGSSHRQTLNAAAHFADFDRPVLVVWAGEDRLFPRALGKRLAGAFPNGHLAIVPESRTLIPHDQPLALAALITEFLETVPAS